MIDYSQASASYRPRNFLSKPTVVYEQASQQRSYSDAPANACERTIQSVVQHENMASTFHQDLTAALSMALPWDQNRDGLTEDNGHRLRDTVVAFDVLCKIHNSLVGFKHRETAASLWLYSRLPGALFEALDESGTRRCECTCFEFPPSLLTMPGQKSDRVVIQEEKVPKAIMAASVGRHVWRHKVLSSSLERMVSEFELCLCALPNSLQSSCSKIMVSSNGS